MATIDTGTDAKPALWLRHAFMIEGSVSMDLVDRKYILKRRGRGATSAAFKYTNAALGGNWAINNPPQFTKWCDIRHPGIGKEDNKANYHKGMGRYYSEAIDDTKQTISVVMGIPRYSTWTSFFQNFYNADTGRIANTGRAYHTWLGSVLSEGIQGVFYILTLPFQVFLSIAGTALKVFNFLAQNSPSKYYYFKSTMHVYWSSVNTLANEFAIGLGLIPRVFNDNENDDTDIGGKVTDSQRKEIHRIFPDLFRENGSIDVMALASRTQRIAVRAEAELKAKMLKAKSQEDIQEAVEAYKQSNPIEDDDGGFSFEGYFQEALKFNAPRGEGADLGESYAGDDWKTQATLTDQMVALARDGNQFVTFRVNYNGSQSESFSNTTETIGSVEQINAKIKQGRTTSVNLMGGNITQGFGSVIGTIKDAINGLLSSVGAENLSILTGSAFIDVPEIWSGSSSSLPSGDYKIPLTTCYGNVISRFINIYLPLAMILPMGLPRSVGRSSYTSPFICQLFQKGRIVKQLCIVDSISVNRGTGNVGWNTDSHMLGCEVNISFKDLTQIMHLPIKAGFADKSLAQRLWVSGINALSEPFGENAQAAANLLNSSVYDEQSAFQDYLLALTSQTSGDFFYTSKRLNLNLTRELQLFKNWRSTTTIMSYIGDTDSVSALRAIFGNRTDRP